MHPASVIANPVKQSMTSGLHGLPRYVRNDGMPAIAFLLITLPWLNPFLPDSTSAEGPLLFSTDALPKGTKSDWHLARIDRSLL